MAVQVTVRFWAGAQRAAGHAQETLSVATLAEVRATLAARDQLREVCAAATFLVDAAQADDDATLADGVIVDVLPPFAGG